MQWRPGVKHPAVRQVTVNVPVFDEFDYPTETRWVVRIQGSDFDIFDGDWITEGVEGVGVIRDAYFRQMYVPVEEE